MDLSHTDFEMIVHTINVFKEIKNKIENSTSNGNFRTEKVQ